MTTNCDDDGLRLALVDHTQTSLNTERDSLKSHWLERGHMTHNISLVDAPSRNVNPLTPAVAIGVQL